MGTTRKRLAALALVACGAAFGVLTSAPVGSAVKPPDSVIVANGPDQPVPTSIVGTPSVSVAGTPTVNVGGTVAVEAVREPFQQFLTAFSNGGEDCSAITVPDGKRLVLESLSADASGTVAPSVYLRVTAAVPNGASFVRSVELDLDAGAGGWSGDVQTLLHTGTPAPGGVTYSLHFCVLRGSGAATGSARGFVSGWLEDA